MQDNECIDEDQNSKDFHQKNLIHIEKLKERKRLLLEEQQMKEQRKAKIQEQLKQKILNEANQRREAKQQQEEANESQNKLYTQQLTKSSSVNRKAPSEKTQQSAKGNKFRSEGLPPLSANPKKEAREQKEQQDPQQASTQKKEAEQINNYYRSRYASFLNTLAEGKKHKQMQEQLEKEKKERIKMELKNQVLASLRESITLKTPEDIIESYKKEKVLTDNLNALDRKKYGKFLVHNPVKYSNVKLKPVKESQQEDKEDVEEEEQQSNETPNRPKKLRSYPFITDLKTWRKKQRLDDSVRVFIIMGGYPDLKKTLLKRGWVENPDHRSPCFDLKFTLMAKDIDYNQLTETQIVNHYEKNTAITTKVGICKNLRNLIWFDNVDIDTFYPRCYDCNDEGDFDDFLEDFKTTKAESILKLYMHFYKQKDQKSIDQIKKRVQVALKVCQRKVLDINEVIDQNVINNLKLVNDKEWDILSADDLSAETLAQKKHEQWLAKIQKEDVPKKKKKNKDKDEIQQEILDQTVAEEDDKADELTMEVKRVLKQFKQKFPQYYLNGWENIWIVKPASLSRGRGIKCYQNLVEILDHVGSKESQWVVQKYIERPLIVQKRKMDIRQWVVVCDWNPLTIWMYDECYIRFSAEAYDSSDLSNQLVHLSNNSIAKKSKKEQEIIGNMWFESQFAQFLQDTNGGEDIFYTKLKPQIKQAVQWSLEAVQDQVENRKNSFEMFGYDFMVDDKNGVWLIEVNSSPAMDYSTHITERLVKEVLQDLAKVIVDYNMASKSSRKDVDTGKFYCLHRGQTTVEKPNTLGLNLCIEGKTIKR